MKKLFAGIAFSVLLLVLLPSHDAYAAVNTFEKNLAGFNAAAGNPPISINFDSIASNTDISSSTISGVTLNQFNAPLIVVVGSNTFSPPEFVGTVIDLNTNKLFPTSGENVLSPGGLELGAGSDPPIEDDDLELIFNPPLSAFGFDILYQSNDFAPFTNIQVFDSSNVQIFSGAAPAGAGGAGAPGGSEFWGIVTTGPDDIGRIVISESDANNANPDSNIGFDTFRFFAPSIPVGGNLIPVDTTPLLLAGTHYTAAWMIPVIVSGIGFAIVIARKF